MVQMKQKAKKIGKIVTYIVAILLLAWLLDSFMYGLVSFAVFVTVFGLYKCWVFRKNIYISMQQVEIMVFGKPLDKDNWKKDELKGRKFKIVWGKHGREKKKKNL